MYGVDNVEIGGRRKFEWDGASRESLFINAARFPDEYKYSSPALMLYLWAVLTV
jgi:hypothetical protein